MTTIISDDQDIRSVLDSLVTLVTSNGGRLNPGVEIVSANGQLSIHSTLDSASQEEIIYVPESCLPSLDDFNVFLDGDKMIAEPGAGNKVSDLHAEMINRMLDLYNLTGKISEHRLSFPVLALKNAPAIMSHLYTGGQCRPGNDKAGDSEHEIIDSFFGSRRFSYVTNAGVKKVIMPIIDCLNHHCSSPGYRQVGLNGTGERGIATYHSRPLASSSECFVRYTEDNDALGLYIKYGFVDLASTIVRSIPLYIDIYGVGRIKVNRFVLPKVALEKIPAEAQDLHYYFPHIKRLNTNTLELSHLMIPPEQAQPSLRRILAMLIRVMAPAMDNDTLATLVQQAESQLLTKNNNFYTELEQLLNLEPEDNIAAHTVETLRLLIRTQKDRLAGYQQRWTR